MVAHFEDAIAIEAAAPDPMSCRRTRAPRRSPRATSGCGTASTPLANVPSIREHGLQRQYARGDAGDGNLSDPSAGMWASTKRPDELLNSHDSAKGVVEFHAHPSEISGNAESPWQAMKKDRTWDNDAVRDWAGLSPP